MANHKNNNQDSNMDFTYEGALDALLKSPLHQAKTKEELEKTAARRTNTIADMKIYLRRICLSSLPKHTAIVHVTGTKGKGSTCCLCESILRNHYGLKTGLFTSPHLVDIRERIRVNGSPVCTKVFGNVYWQVRKRLEENSDIGDDDPDLPILPGYFRMLTLMALFTFAHYSHDNNDKQGRGLDVIILEVGMGGRYDATNIVDMTQGRNVVCGVTLLDLDHTRVLGDTLEQIAWEKGGIFQTIKGQPASNADTGTQTQQDLQAKQFFAIDTNIASVLSVLKKCAKEDGRGRELHLVGVCTSLIPSNVTIGLPGDHQRINAELAVALCQAVVANSTLNIKPMNGDSLMLALAEARWPGRCQTVTLDNTSVPIHLRLDGSHTPISLQAGYDWFTSVSSDTRDAKSPAQCKRVLIFNCSHERNPVELLKLLLQPSSSSATKKVPSFEMAFFCRSDFERPSAVTKKNANELLTEQGILPRNQWLPDSDDTATVTTWQMTLEAIWKHLENEAAPAETVANLTVAEAIDRIQSNCGDASVLSKVEVLVAGSLYLVGSALKAIKWSEPDADGRIILEP